MKCRISTIIILIWVLCLLQLASAVCECENDQQSFTPSHFFIEPSSSLNGTNGSSSDFSSACMKSAGLYQCTNNSNNLFDCNASNNQFYGWDISQLDNPISVVANFTSRFQAINMSVTFLVSTSSDVAAPALLHCLLTLNGISVSSSIQGYLPANLPEGTYQHDLKLSSDIMFNGVVIAVTPNASFQWTAISNIAFCGESTTATPAPSNDNDSDSVRFIIISLEAVVATILLIIIVLLIIFLLHVIRRRKMAESNDVKAATIELSSRSDVTKGGGNAAGTLQHGHKDDDTLSQGTNIDPALSLEIINELVSTRTKSLDLLIPRDSNKSTPPSIVDHDIPITPNPSYAATEIRPKSKHEYEYIVTDKSSHEEYLQLIGSDGPQDNAVTTCTAHDDYVINSLSSYNSQPQESQDVTQEDDFLPYVRMNAAK